MTQRNRLTRTSIASSLCVVGLLAAPIVTWVEPLPTAAAAVHDQQQVHDQQRGHDQQRTPELRDQGGRNRRPDRPSTDRGKIVSAVPVRDLTAAEVRTALRDAGYPTDQVRYGLRAYRVVYRTIDYSGRRTTASGLVSFPDNRHRLRAVLFAHGTSPSKDEVPSTGIGDYHQAGALSFAGAGFASVAPDYLGLGVGPGRPVYLDTRTEVSASVDLLRAARSLAADFGRRLDHEVHLTGFSQGAHVALTTARALQEGEGGRGLRVGAVAPISGAYALREHEIPAILDGSVRPKLATLYTGFLFTSWNAVHGIYDDPRQVFREPYATIVDDLYDGTHSSQEIFESMPETPAQLLTDDGMALLRDPTGPFGAAVDEYDAACRGWRPDGPIRLYFAQGDDEAVNGNTEACVADFADSGKKIPTVDLGHLDHSGSGAEGVVAAARWFRSIDDRQR